MNVKTPRAHKYTTLLGLFRYELLQPGIVWQISKTKGLDDDCTEVASAFLSIYDIEHAVIHVWIQR
jgi:hypothetical protein